jgi:hypothetical protein
MSSENVFWINDPSVLLNKNVLMELYPKKTMGYESKLNALTRTIIAISLLGFFFTRNINLLFFGLLTVIVIVVLYKYKNPQKNDEKYDNIEAFNNNENDLQNMQITNYLDERLKCQEKIITPESLNEFVDKTFQPGDKYNPMSNVLLTEIVDTPQRNSAPPAFTPDIYEDIVDNTKKMIQHLNPGIKNTNKQMFSSLTDNFDFDQFMRPFYSTPSTKVIGGDQASFGKWLYGNMPSAKESSPMDNIQREKDSYRYTLY